MQTRATTGLRQTGRAHQHRAPHHEVDVTSWTKPCVEQARDAALCPALRLEVRVRNGAPGRTRDSCWLLEAPHRRDHPMICACCLGVACDTHRRMRPPHPVLRPLRGSLRGHGGTGAATVDRKATQARTGGVRFAEEAAGQEHGVAGAGGAQMGWATRTPKCGNSNARTL